MAENRTSLSDNLIAAGLDTSNPADTYVNFAQQIAKNQQEQAASEQALELAKQHVAQAQLETQQKTAANAAGVNPFMAEVLTPDQAKEYLMLILKEKGLQISEDDINNWIATFNGQPVNRNVVETFANRFARESTRAGAPGHFTTDQKIVVPANSSAKDVGLVDMTDHDGNEVPADTKSDGTYYGHVPEDGMYYVVYDNQGKVKEFLPGGKEPTDPSAKEAKKASDTAEKSWQKLDGVLNTFTRSMRGNALSSAVARAARAINELADGETLTPQVLNYIQKDVSGIFQGGVPPVTGMEAEDFTTTMQKLNGFIQKYTGVSGYLHTDLGNQRDYLLNLLSRLYETTVNMIKAQIVSEAAGYKPIIEAQPDRWQQMVDDKIKTMSSGLSATGAKEMEDRKMPTEPEKIPGVKGSSKNQTKLPSVDDIDAELAKRTPKGNK